MRPLRDGMPGKVVFRALAARGGHAISERLVGHEAVDPGSEITRILLRMDRFKRAALLLFQRDQQAGFPCTTTSLMPPTALATTAVSQAIASRLMMPKGS
jgi:hypothetical protein